MLMLAFCLAYPDNSDMEIKSLAFEIPTTGATQPLPEVKSATTQNGTLRAIFKDPIETSAVWMTDRYPDLEASHITAAGTIGCLAVAAIANRHPTYARGLSWAHLFFSLTDAFDGAVARIQATKRGTTTSLHGALFDTACDRQQEFGASLAQSYLAKQRANKLGQSTLLAFAATSALPSLTRGIAESRGIVVSEGSLGNRHTRVTLNCLGYFWNEHPKRVQALSAIGAGLNIYNASQRLRALQPESPLQKGTLDPKLQAEAAVRRNMLTAIAAVFGGLSLKAATKK